jgi:hypothetical protein
LYCGFFYLRGIHYEPIFKVSRMAGNKRGFAFGQGAIEGSLSDYHQRSSRFIDGISAQCGSKIKERVSL